ncbi:MAG: DNA translocase FtsK 4TM domain-containing protein [Desulfovibrionaceae bacterium]|nr:DNA translocase FtsK 4TM domain-containing protein [Desulfovibrionaceae bacterium]
MSAADKKNEGRSEAKGWRREILAMCCLFLAAFLFMSLFSFDPGDPALNQAVSKGWKVRNVAGAAGAYAAGLLVDMFGLGALIWPFVFLYLGLSRFITRLRIPKWRLLGAAGLYVSMLAWLSHPWFCPTATAEYGLAGGGVFGHEVINRLTIPFLRPAGAFLLWLFLSAICLQVFLGFSWAGLLRRIRSLAYDLWCAWLERRRTSRALKAARLEAELEKKAASGQTGGAAVRSRTEKRPQKQPARPKPDNGAKPGGRELPGLELLSPPPVNRTTLDPKSLETQAQRLISCLADFNIQGEIQQIKPGPVVTMFEFKPAPGVKISRIEALNDDIALAMKALAVRIVAPIPGKDSVGVEIPNEKRQTVYLREILESEIFATAASPLTLALGKDIHGATQVADLARMPHLLVAGATGAGKSVCLNAFLLSLLFKADPDTVKLLLVDPKRIELAVYASLPHLVHPVVTETAMAKSALEWAVFEMESRYEAMARLGAKNIEAYNQKLAGLGDDRPEDIQDLKPLPYLVIVIDELADLMMTAAKEVELCIVRLAQLSRAAGINMILATQRPSVDVVTGLIKANFPTRISFQVSSKPDSRTILDTVGAENLLGRGDMLFKHSGSRLQRMHAPYVDDREIAAVVRFWQQHRPQEFEIDFARWTKDSQGNGGLGAEEGGMADDPLYAEAVDFVLSQGKASISLIQRRFRIGFNRAARYIEQMEADGLLGPQEGSKPRMVIPPKD